jgi:glutamine---fructose-6-phosphate transaminase (isomerizing)
MRSSIIEGPYLHDLLDQPQALRETWERLSIPSGVLRMAEELRSGRLRRVVLTGMGSSYHALCPLHLALAQAGFAVQWTETSELIHFMRECLTPETLVVAVSQSGRSAETLGLLELAGAGFSLLGVTNDAGSPLAAGAHGVMLIHAGRETSVSCKTYVASLLELEWMAAILTGQGTARAREVLSQAAPAVAGYLANLQDHLRDLRAVAAGVERVFVVGRGPSLATAGTGGLILKEAARVVAEGMSSAAFRHGPLESVNGSVLVVVMAGHGPCEVLNRRLAADVCAAGGRAEVVDMRDAHPAFCIPTVPEPLRPLVEILPVQMLSLVLAERKGHEPGKFGLATKITATE